jgi:hypothetical protein
VLGTQGRNLYMRGVFEQETRVNLSEKMSALMDGASSGVCVVNDKKLQGPLRVRVILRSTMQQ